jgi:hypothetical protein
VERLHLFISTISFFLSLLLLFSYSFASDMYNVGIVAYQMASGGVLITCLLFDKIAMCLKPSHLMICLLQNIFFYSGVHPFREEGKEVDMLKMLVGEHDGLSGRNITSALKELILLMMHLVWIYIC